MYQIIKRGRLVFFLLLLLALITTYALALYKLQVVEGEQYYEQSRNTIVSTQSVTAARGDILDRYGRVLVSNRNCNNLTLNRDELFEQEDPNGIILELCETLTEGGYSYNDELPISMETPFSYDEDMTVLDRERLDEYLEIRGLSGDISAVDLMAWFREQFDIDPNYDARQMRIIAGIRYTLSMHYFVKTSDYVFAEDVDIELISHLMESNLQGFNVEISYIREYNTIYAAHILGYVGAIPANQAEYYTDLGYPMNAMVGLDGAEYAFEEYLHGKDGKVSETQNNAGTVLSTVYIEEPTPGDHIYLTIDKVLQEQTERILNNSVNTMILNRNQERLEGIERGDYDPEMKDEITGAAAVVVKVNTGEPLAIASWPTYDGATIIEKYSELMETPNAPLFNRALMGAYAPGSAFKPCVATAVLTEGQINTEYKIKCEGVFTKYAAEGYAPECWIWNSVKGEHYTHPEENVTTALRDSCNYFFYSVGHDLGIDKMGEYAHAYGLGSSTGIELIETKGNMSNEANHADYTGTVWRIGDTMQAAIGQSDSIFSPLQLAEYCATVANSGHRYSASILKTVRSYDYSQKIYEREPEVLNTIRSAEYNWLAIHEGMYMVLNDWINQQNAEVWTACSWICAGKTGTAQKGEKITNDGIFICYGPYSDPDVAIAVVVERGGSGANVQRIARRIMDAYINICSYSDSSEDEMTLLR